MDNIHRENLVSDHERQLHHSFLVAIELGRPEGPGPRFSLLVNELTQDLLEHMAEEEEHLFPWLMKRLPGREQLVHALAREHVEVIRLLALLKEEGTSGEVTASRPGIELVKKFVRLLDHHTKLECDVLIEADAAGVASVLDLAATC